MSRSKAATGSDFFQTHLLRAPSCHPKQVVGSKEPFHWTSLEVSNGWSIPSEGPPIPSEAGQRSRSQRREVCHLHVLPHQFYALHVHPHGDPSEKTSSDPGTQKKLARKHGNTSTSCTHGWEVHLCSQHLHLPAPPTTNVALRACLCTILLVLLSSSILDKLSPFVSVCAPFHNTIPFWVFLNHPRQTRHQPTSSSAVFPCLPNGSPDVSEL